MDKEIKEMLKNIKEMLEIVEESDLDKTKEKFEKMLNEALNQPCEIAIKKDKDGGAKTKVEGCRLSLLITLAGLEKTLCKQLHCSDGEFELIKNLVGTKDADDVEVL